MQTIAPRLEPSVFKRDVDAMRQRGLARGVAGECVVVIDDYEILNPDGLRFADELFALILDAVGDMALIGMPIVADISMSRSGHALNAKLVEEILSSELNYDVVVSKASERNSLPESFPSGFSGQLSNRSDLGLIPRREAPVLPQQPFHPFRQVRVSRHCRLRYRRRHSLTSLRDRVPEFESELMLKYVHQAKQRRLSQYRNLGSGSRLAKVSTALRFGAPVMEPPGKSASSMS